MRLTQAHLFSLSWCLLVASSPLSTLARAWRARPPPKSQNSQTKVWGFSSVGIPHFTQLSPTLQPFNPPLSKTWQFWESSFIKCRNAVQDKRGLRDPTCLNFILKAWEGSTDEETAHEQVRIRIIAQIFYISNRLIFKAIAPLKYNIRSEVL